MSFVNDMQKTFILGVFSLFILLQPFYLWSSGLPQIGDLFGFLFIIISLIIFKKVKIPYDITLIIFFVFFWIVIVNGIWGIILNEARSLGLMSLTYLFNFLLVYTVATAVFKYGDQFLKLLLILLAITLVSQFFLLLVIPSDSTRQTAFFNNPNQLGYFSLLTLSLFIIISKRIKVSFILRLTVYYSAVLITFYSLSKAAMISTICLIMIELGILLFLNKNKLNGLFLTIITVLSVPFIITNKSKILAIPLISSVYNRVNTVGQDGDDNLAGRGYDRLFNHDEYLIFGAGEGMYQRFDSIPGEMHSTFGNFIFSYGIIGFFMLSFMIFLLIRKSVVSVYYPLFFLLMYGITHNGIRQSMLWIIISIIFTISVMKDDTKRNIL